MKKACLALGSALTLLALAPPALGKGIVPVEARITGPGLDRPIVMADRDGPWGTGAFRRLSLFADLALPYEHDDPSVTRRPPAPIEDLGPRYLIAWRFRPFDGSRAVTVEQTLFPYARGGPALFLRAAGRVRELKAGWMQAPAVTRVNLRAWGLPDAPRLHDGPVAEGDRALTTPRSVAVVVTTLTLAVSALLVRRRRDTPLARDSV